MLCLSVLRQVSFDRWESGSGNETPFPGVSHGFLLLVQAPSIALPQWCVCSPFMERIPPSGFKRMSPRGKKSVPELWSLHSWRLERASASVLSPVRSRQQNGARRDGRSSKPRRTRCGAPSGGISVKATGFLPWWMDTSSVRARFLWVWGHESSVNYFTCTLQ